MKINKNNYEEFFFDYTEGNLSSQQRTEVEQFVLLHPDLAEELQAYRDSVLVADETIVFTRKQQLMQTEEKPGVVFLWRKVIFYAAAAVVLLSAGFVFLNKAPETQTASSSSLASNDHDMTTASSADNHVVVPGRSDDNVQFNHSTVSQSNMSGNQVAVTVPVRMTIDSMLKVQAIQPVFAVNQVKTLPVKQNTRLVAFAYAVPEPDYVKAAYLPSAFARNNAKNQGYNPARWLQAAGSVANDVVALSGRSQAFAASGNTSRSPIGNISVDLGFIKYFHHSGR